MWCAAKRAIMSKNKIFPYFFRSIISLVIVFFAFTVSVIAQPAALAENYYENGEYEKAGSLFETLYKEKGGDYYFDKYLNCLFSLRRFDDAEKLITKQIKKEPNRVGLYYSYGRMFELNNKPDQATEQYNKAIDKLPTDFSAIADLASQFENNSKFELALKTYERGGVLLKNKNIFGLGMAEAYQKMDDTPHMMAAYLNALSDNAAVMPSIKARVMRYVTTSDAQKDFLAALYAKIQEEPKNVSFPDLLSWFFMLKKDYKNAFRQLKAVDRMNGEDGNRIFNLSSIAQNDKEYDAAIEGYTYIINEKGRLSPFYIDAKNQQLVCKRSKLVEGFTYTEPELRALETEYNSFLNEVGKNNRTASIMAELADLEAFYIKDVDKAISLLEEVIHLPMLEPEVLDRSKLSLGDFYIVKGERWEATLLYSQVDKQHKDDILGNEARFKNAKLSYYFNDFDWAKAQFDILKSATSKLISNDAIEMSVFLQENLDADSSTTALEMYARAELCVFQNKYDSAFVILDSINAQFPTHPIEDDVLYLRAQMFKNKRQYPEALAAYSTIVEKYKESIRADNALFEMAQIYELRLNNKEKAKELYEKLFTDYSGSTLTVEARRRFRILRGDKVPNDAQ